MNKIIKLNNKTISYTLKTNTRAKRLRFTIYPDGTFVVSAPKDMDQKTIEEFLSRKSKWILKKMDYNQTHPTIIPDPKKSKARFIEYKDRALELAKRKVICFNQFYHFPFKKITIKNQKTRWGSCSKKGNLNFNYKIILLPERLTDYIIVHELCHLGAFNHSQKFWNLVEKTIPNYLEVRKELKNHLHQRKL